MKPVQTIEYLGVVIDSIRMTLSLTEEKVEGILQECKIIFSMKEITVLQSTQLVGLLSSAIQAVLPTQIQFRYLQLQQVLALKGGIEGIEVIPNSIPIYLLENENVSDRSVCFQVIQSNSNILCLETRPTQFSYGCNITRMEPENSICISPFSLIQRVLCKRAQEKVSTVILIAPAWQTQPWYLNLFAMSRPPLGNKQIFSTSGLEGCREMLVK